MQRLLIALGLCSYFVAQLEAQDVAELLARMKAMEHRLQLLESEVKELRTKQDIPASVTASLIATQEKMTEPPSPAEPVATSAGALPNYGAATMGNKVFNPEIAAIGTFRGVAGYGAGRSPSALELQEGEVSFQSIVDPYARADVFLSFGEQGVDIEEGYLTFSALPGNLGLRAGKMRAAFGKVNTMHLHIVPWIDRPLVTQNLLNGEEGISDAGLSVTRTIPAPRQVFLEATAQIFRGDSGDVFKSYSRSDVSTIGHLRGYRDITESTNLELGFSYARGNSTLGPTLANQLFGMDATLRWKPLRRSIYRSFLARTEAVWSRAESSAGVSSPFGYYVSGEYQLARRWLLGGRFDQSDQMEKAFLRDTGGSLLLTYRPSEFSQIRGQLRRTTYGDQRTANEVLFQLIFAIGAHGAHPF